VPSASRINSDGVNRPRSIAALVVPSIAARILRVLCSFAFGASAWLACPASAEADQPSPGDPAVVEARQHFERGIALFEHRDYDGALAEFLRAHEQSGRPTVLYNIGATYHQLHRYPEALDSLRRFLAETPTGPSRERADAERALREIEALLAYVRVQIVPAEAQLTLDGRAVHAGDEFAVGPGRHRIEAQLDGYRTSGTEVVIASGEHRDVSVRLEPNAPASPPTGAIVAPHATTAHLTVAGVSPEAVITIGGARHPASAPIDLPPGRHGVTVGLPATLPWTGFVTLRAGDSRTLRVSLVSDRGGVAPGVFWGVLSASLGLGAGAAGTGIAAIATNSAFHGPLSNEQEATDLAVRGRALAIAADILGLSSLLGGIGSLWIFTQTDFVPRRSTAVIATAGSVPNGAWLGARGWF